MRIHVTGNAGAGKTTLARRIARRHNLPVHHLDGIVWAPNWKKRHPKARDARINELVQAPSWIIEGVSETVRSKADVVIVLTTPTHRCLHRCIVRCFAVGFRNREELPPDCPEILILFRAIRIVLAYPRRAGRQIVLEAEDDPRYHLCKDASHANATLQSVLGLTDRSEPEGVAVSESQ